MPKRKTSWLNYSSTKAELEAEADDPEWEYMKEFEVRREFVPITITPASDIYLSKMQPHPRTQKRS